MPIYINTKTDKEEKFSLVKPGAEQFKNEPFVQHDLKTLYVQACRELTLQQDKRDKTISIYVAVIAFLVPFLFSKETTTLEGFHQLTGAASRSRPAPLRWGN